MLIYICIHTHTHTHTHGETFRPFLSSLLTLSIFPPVLPFLFPLPSLPLSPSCHIAVQPETLPYNLPPLSSRLEWRALP